VAKKMPGEPGTDTCFRRSDKMQVQEGTNKLIRTKKFLALYTVTLSGLTSSVS